MNKVVPFFRSLIFAMLVFSNYCSYSQIATTQLYITNPSQAIDRIDPIATIDESTAQSLYLSTVITCINIGVTNSSQAMTSPPHFNHLTGSVNTLNTIYQFTFLFIPSKFSI